MNEEPLSLEHAGRLKEKLKPIGNGLSEYCFANLFLFRRVHDYAVIFDNLAPLGVRGKTYDGTAFFMPLFDLTRTDDADLVRLIDAFGCLYPVSREALDQFDPGRFRADHNRDDADYVFVAEKLRFYAGRKLAAKRNLMKQFMAAHRVSCRPYHSDLKHDAEMVLEQWQLENGNPRKTTDYYSAREALALSRELDLFGYIYYADEAPAGFVLAGENAPGMCVVHFAKGGRRFKGVFPYMFNHFSNAMADRFVVYNFEQDLGKANFRKNKQSYYPDRLLTKYQLRLKD